MTEALAGIVSWYMANINYGTIALLMTVESSFIPFPSEIVVPPAAWKAAQGELNVVLVVLSATAGALCGAFINYYLARFLGRPVLYRLADTRLAHMLLIKRQSLEKAEAFFTRYGKTSTLVGRLVPAVRQLISIPAGLSRMNLATFLAYTALGAGLWNIVLAVLGYSLYSQKKLLAEYYHILSIASVCLGVCFAGFLLYQNVLRKK